MYFDEVETDDDALLEIISRIEEQHGCKMRRIARTAQHDGKFYVTLILRNYELIEVTITASNIGHLVALECEVEVY